MEIYTDRAAEEFFNATFAAAMQPRALRDLHYTVLVKSVNAMAADPIRPPLPGHPRSGDGRAMPVSADVLAVCDGCPEQVWRDAGELEGGQTHLPVSSLGREGV